MHEPYQPTCGSARRSTGAELGVRPDASALERGSTTGTTRTSTRSTSPTGPYPSGRITEEEVFQQVYFHLLAVWRWPSAVMFGPGHDILANPLNSVGSLACFGALVSCIYQRKSYKLKAEGWRRTLFALRRVGPRAAVVVLTQRHERT